MKKKIALFLALIMCLNINIKPANADIIEQGLPDVYSKSYVVIDESSGEVLFSKNADDSVDMSNFAQVMTALVALEKGTLTDNVTVGNIPEEYGNKVMLRSGEKVVLENLIKAVVVYNATDASVAVAEHIGGSDVKFVKLMNDKAQELGMKDTVFTNVYGGVESGQKTTANDMAILASAVAHNEKYMQYAQMDNLQWQGDVRSNSVLENTNKFSSIMSEANGIKMGDNRSGMYSLMASINKDGREIIAVSMGCELEDTMYNDMKNILNFALNNTKIVPIIQKDNVMTVIEYNENEAVRVAAANDYSLLIAKANSAVTGYNIKLSNVEVPIKKGDKMGVLEILVNSTVVDTVELVSLDDAKRNINWFFVITLLISILYVVQIGFRIYVMVKREKRKKEQALANRGVK